MPNLRSCRIDASGFHAVASDGRTVTVGAGQLKARHDGETGSPVQRKAAVVGWFMGVVEASLGREQVDAAQLALDYDPTTGRPTDVQHGRE